MSDNKELGISEELRQFVEALVNEVVIEGTSFENYKRYLFRFCGSENIEYESLEKNLIEFFDVLGEWKSLQTKSSSMMAKILARDCCLSEDFVEQLLTAVKVEYTREEPEKPRRQLDLGQEENVSEYQELMADLIPDLVQKKERLDVHLYFVKKIAQNSGLDGDEIATALSDFLSMYCDFLQEHPGGEAFTNSETRLLKYQATLAHIDQSVLETIL